MYRCWSDLCEVRSSFPRSRKDLSTDSDTDTSFNGLPQQISAINFGSLKCGDSGQQLSKDKLTVKLIAGRMSLILVYSRNLRLFSLVEASDVFHSSLNLYSR